jgi:hypothetical protein
MSHTLICGVTESGKTTLAHALASRLAASGAGIVAFDPVGSMTAGGGWPPGAIVFDDLEEFMAYMDRPDVNNAHVFIDEAGEVFNIGARENFWLLTRGRHFGLHCYMIAQRPKMLAPSARTQAARAYLFRLSPDDLREIGADFGHGGLEKIILDRGDFLVLNSGHTCKKRANIFKLLESSP